MSATGSGWQATNAARAKSQDRFPPRTLPPTLRVFCRQPPALYAARKQDTTATKMLRRRSRQLPAGLFAKEKEFALERRPTSAESVLRRGASSQLLSMMRTH